MHGIFHRALKQLVIEELGAPCWSRIETDLGLGAREQIGFESYPDELTFTLCDAAASAFDIPAADFQRNFGRYWIRFASEGHYASTMAYTGATLGEFLANLDRLHWGVATMFPKAVVPSFSLEEVPQGWRLAYRSARTGLDMMMIGLLEGLLELFGEAGAVSQLPPQDGAAMFLISRAETVTADAT